MTPFSPLQPIEHPLFTKHQVRVSIKRDDLLHPIISGNKWRKLKYNILNAQQGKLAGILSFGGSYSNHIHALAFACHQANLPVIGIIRGEKSNQDNFTLSWARHWGMQLHFVDRQTYRLREDNHYLATLKQQYPNYAIVPEGGSNALALKGVEEVISELNQQTQFDVLMTPVGSGGTLAGLVKGDNNQHHILGVAVLKQDGYLTKQVNQLLGQAQAQQYHHWRILNDFHCGGYAKFSSAQAQDILHFAKICQIDFEPIYSGKMVLALLSLLAQGHFKSKQHIVLLHTGGLQGLAGLHEQQRITGSEWPLPPEPPAR